MNNVNSTSLSATKLYLSATSDVNYCENFLGYI